MVKQPFRSLLAMLASLLRVLVWFLATELLIQLPAVVLRMPWMMGEVHGFLPPMCETSGIGLDPSFCKHLSSELVGGRCFSLSLPLFNSALQLISFFNHEKTLFEKYNIKYNSKV